MRRGLGWLPWFGLGGTGKAQGGSADCGLGAGAGQGGLRELGALRAGLRWELELEKICSGTL